MPASIPSSINTSAAAAAKSKRSGGIASKADAAGPGSEDDESAAFLTPSTALSPQFGRQAHQQLPHPSAAISTGGVAPSYPRNAGTEDQTSVLIGRGTTASSALLTGRAGRGAADGEGGDDDEDDEDDVEMDDVMHGGAGDVTGTIASSCTNLTNTILGSGMLAMPAALDAVGLFLGSGFIAMSASLSIFGLTLLSHCAARIGRRASFFAVSKITYPAAAVWFDLAIAVKCFGVSISYLVIIRDLVPGIVRAIFPETFPEGSSSWLVSRTFWVTASVLTVAPFAFARRLDSLRYTSALALMAVVYLVFIVVGYFIFPTESMLPRPKLEDLVYFRIDGGFFKTLPIFVFAFTCHQNIFAVHNELVNNTIPRVTGVVKYSIGTAFGVYQLIGILGYLSFGPGVASNIIQEYPQGAVITAGQSALAVLFLLSYPLQAHPARACLDK
ncbi:hypothetical protein HK101_008080, partial [Irineochytrium annulatum]